MLKLSKSIRSLLFTLIIASPVFSQNTDSYIQLKTGLTSFSHLRSDGFYSIRPDFPTTENYECLGLVVGSDWSLLGYLEHVPNNHFRLGDYFAFRAGIGREFNNVNGKGSVATGNIYQGYTGMSGPAEEVSSLWYLFNIALGIQASYRINDDYSFGLRYYGLAEADALRQVVTDDELWAMGIFGNIGRYSGKIDWKMKSGYPSGQYFKYFSLTLRRGFGKGYQEYFGLTFDYFADFVPGTNDINPNIVHNNIGTNIELAFSFGFSLN